MECWKIRKKVTDESALGGDSIECKKSAGTRHRVGIVAFMVSIVAGDVWDM